MKVVASKWTLGPPTFPGCQKVGGLFRYERWWFPELRFSQLFSTTRPSSTGEKLVLYNLCAGARFPDAP